MARLMSHDGGWFTMEQDGELQDGQLPMRLRVKLWHPGFWLFALRTWLGR